MKRGFCSGTIGGSVRCVTILALCRNLKVVVGGGGTRAGVGVSRVSCEELAILVLSGVLQRGEVSDWCLSPALGQGRSAALAFSVPMKRACSTA